MIFFCKQTNKKKKWQWARGKLNLWWKYWTYNNKHNCSTTQQYSCYSPGRLCFCFKVKSNIIGRHKRTHNWNVSLSFNVYSRTILNTCWNQIATMIRPGRGLLVQNIADLSFIKLAHHKLCCTGLSACNSKVGFHHVPNGWAEWWQTKLAKLASLHYSTV